jgi:hypothetical protein
MTLEAFLAEINRPFVPCDCPWPSLSVHRYPWGWAVQLCWIAWGVDASYDYRKEQFSGGGNKP